MGFTGVVFGFNGATVIAGAPPLPISLGGTGTTAPVVTAGANITITGTWPFLTISGTINGTVTSVTASAPIVSSGGANPNISFAGILGTTQGGTGTATPIVTAGANITITGAWPNYTISSIAGGGTLPIAQGGTGSTVQNFVDLSTSQTIYGTKNFAATITAGTGGTTGVGQVTANGGNSGIGGGAFFVAAVNGATVISIGNKSAVTGTAYDATPYIYTIGTLTTNDSLAVGGGISATALSVFTDAVFARSATSGVIYVGSNANQYLDYGVSVPGRFSLIGGGLGIAGPLSGATSGAFSGKLTAGPGGINPRWFNVKDYGALGDNSRDDGVSINNAITAAGASTEGKGVVFFPPGSYLTSVPIVMKPNVSIFTFGGSSIAATGASTNGIVFPAGNYSQGLYRLPNVFNFPNGAGILMQAGCGLAELTVGTVSGCQSGVRLEANAAGNNLGNTIRFNTISGCILYGIILLGLSGAADVIQGHLFIGNFINGCKFSIFLGGVAGTGPSINDNYFLIPAVEAGGVAGTQGITFDSCGIGGPNVFSCEGFFGGFMSGFVVATNGAIVNAQTFRLGVTGSTAYTDFNALASGSGNSIIDTAAPYYVGGTPSATISTNTRASFNGGLPVVASAFALSFTFPAVAAGALVTFYAYSPFTGKNTLSPRFTMNGFVNARVALMGIQDQSSTTFPNEIAITFHALAAITAGATALGFLEVGI